MNDQYYTPDPHSASNPQPFNVTVCGKALHFTTDAGVFSRGELDQGTRLLLEALPPLTGTALDLGCGWGAVGVTLACVNEGLRVVMSDVNRRALALAAENARRNGAACETVESDGFSALEGRVFDTIVTNPPIRAGKQVIYRMFADAAAHLAPGGALYIVIRKQQGAESAIRYLSGIYEHVEKKDRSGGFWVLCASSPKEEATHV